MTFGRLRMVQVCAADHMAYYSLRPLMRAATEADWEVAFACADGDYAAAMRAEGFSHLNVPMTRSFVPGPQLLALVTLARALRRYRADLVHTHTPVGGVVGRAAARLAGIRHVAHTLHGLPFVGRPRSLADHIFLASERALAPSTGLFLSQSQVDAALAAQLRIAPAERTVVVGNGIDIERFKPDPGAREITRDELGINPNDIVITIVARLVREKGLIELADAAHALREDTRLVFLVVGRSEKTDRSHLERDLAAHPAARALGRRWKLLGRRDDVERLLQASDIYVLPTHREGLPRSVIEAMATGLPVIASDIPACRELVDEGRTGLLVRTGDARAIAKAITRLASGADRDAMGRRARGISLVRYDERRVIESQLRLLRDLVGPAG